MKLPLNGTGLVDTANGLVSRAIFSDPEIFRREREMVFARSWLFVGHESQLPRNNDFFVSQAGHEPVIVSRDGSGTVRVMLNSCRHRGMPVCRYDRGNAATFTCAYHNWAYAIDGSLAGVPLAEKGYGGNLDPSAWGLRQARVACYYGSIWTTFCEDAPSFDEFLGDGALLLRDFMQSPDGEDDGWEVVEGIVKYAMPANWKFGAENNGGDLYHDPSHRSVQRLGIAMSGKKGRHAWEADTAPFRTLNVGFPAGGHLGRVSLYDDAQRPYVSMWGQNPAVDDYFAEAHAKRQRRLGDKSRFYNRGGIIFPSFAYNAAGRTTISAWVPRAPGLTDVWRWYLVPKDAPQDVKDALRHYLLRYGGPTGMVEQDDIENWSAAQRGAEMTQAAGDYFNYQLQLGNAQWAWPVPWLGAGALVDEGVSENSQRIFYAKWNAMMEGLPSTSLHAVAS